MNKLVFTFLSLLSVAMVQSPTFADNKEDGSKALSFKMKTLEGKEQDLSQYKGKVVLIVNVASQCGLTPQYTELQSMYEKYKDKGLVVLGFPCNQFGSQEPGSSKEISEFCSKKYSVTFDMFEKVDVNGDNACQLYKYLTAQKAPPKGEGKVTWNFEKFLLNRKGELIARFQPRTEPNAKEIVEMIERELNAQ